MRREGLDVYHPLRRAVGKGGGGFPRKPKEASRGDDPSKPLAEISV